MRFQFPATIFVNSNTPGEQLDHIFSEIDELVDLGPELDAVLDDDQASNAVRARIEAEVMDLYHSCETFLRILDIYHGEGYVMKLWEQTEAKNRARGYYGS